MIKKVLGAGLILGLLAFFAYWINNLAYSVGVFAGFFGIVFSLLTYLGASCTLATNLGVMLNGLLLILLVFKVYGYFKDS